MDTLDSGTEPKRRTVRFGTSPLPDHDAAMAATVVELKTEAESRVIELNKCLRKTARAAKDMVVSMSQWRQLVKEIIVAKYQALDALKESRSKVSRLIAENAMLSEHNANLSHDTQSLLKIIRQARSTGNWEMECMTFCEIPPEEVYGPVCRLSATRDSSDWPDMVNGSTNPEWMQNTPSENGSTSHLLHGEPWMHHLEIYTALEVQKVEKKLTEYEIELVEKDRIIADLECKVTSLRCKISKNEADFLEHLSRLDYYEAMIQEKGQEHSLHPLRNTTDKAVRLPHHADASTQADFNSAPRDQLCFTPYAESCPSLHTPEEEECWLRLASSKKLPFHCTVRDGEHTLLESSRLAKESCERTILHPSALSPKCGMEPTDQSGVPLRGARGEMPTPEAPLGLIQDSQIQTDEKQTVHAGAQTTQTNQEVQPGDLLRDVNMADEELKYLDLATTPVQTDLSSAPKEQLHLTPRSVSCPSLHSIPPEKIFGHGWEPSKPSEGLSKGTGKEASTTEDPLNLAQDSQGKGRHTVHVATQAFQTNQELCEPFQASMVQQREPISDVADNAALGQPSPELRASISARDVPVSSGQPQLQHGLFSCETRNYPCHATGRDAGDGFYVLPSSYRQSFCTGRQLRDSHCQTEFSSVAMGVQTDFKLEESSKGAKNQEVESLKERLILMEERVSSKDILLSQLHTHLESACKEVELKDKALENVEKKLTASRLQCETLKNNVVIHEHKVKELNENLEELGKEKRDMEDTVQAMKVTEQNLHEQKRSLLTQLDSIAEETVKYKEEVQELKKKLALKETEVKHQLSTISNLQQAVLNFKNAVKPQQQTFSTRREGSSSNGQIHNI